MSSSYCPSFSESHFRPKSTQSLNFSGSWEMDTVWHPLSFASRKVFRNPLQCSREDPYFSALRPYSAFIFWSAFLEGMRHLPGRNDFFPKLFLLPDFFPLRIFCPGFVFRKMNVASSQRAATIQNSIIEMRPLKSSLPE
jgi:hypothetical protein